MAKDANGVPLEVGDRVYWEDPDDGLCSGFRTVVAVGVPDGEQSVTLEEDGGGLVEAYARECIKGMRMTVLTTPRKDKEND